MTYMAKCLKFRLSPDIDRLSRLALTRTLHQTQEEEQPVRIRDAPGALRFALPKTSRVVSALPHTVCLAVYVDPAALPASYDPRAGSAPARVFKCP
jgi:hypothetical protein